MEKVRYSVELPLVGNPGQYFTVCRADTPEGAAEVVRIILSQRDAEVNEICVRVVKQLQ